ncbi:phenazine biosynthesis FMN-dependent oxidase PhzG [Streptomyces griseus]|uniref:Phenazine biosynthesis FMN-dependent oxidase PhzG n=1 Tax=Streptomyces sp. CMC78 TaxID=3231512 RepID=A0AB33KT50_9ACTN|nr:phenazine biosynthesis FMN-dependent oxidase PhzG [Streptomyces sp. ID01-9D]MDX5575166.1 phenazine biosynthesis FMN-dependent oxidase PhzG [Streptomyces sp. ID01-9D]WSV20715.1 phenazine biosynthesis FMN-dependent oxidase PhzG [Streptomyces fimicarius]WTC90378.1 phenazine biosynthesis FMN-dependent oxidase PhzG [Streptomyces griseus]WTD66992.1 phenazine biosynthesis FMN-dependent oxidase PhzG [Streptomyces griseus]
MAGGRSETLTGSVEIPFPEYHHPPAGPAGLFRQWYETALRTGVREPKALALATADRRGRPSSRIVAVNEITDEGIVFATHLGSQKGRELTENPWASGTLYWRETSQQINVSGAVELLGREQAEEKWLSRPLFTYPASVVSRQSEELVDLAAIRAEIDRMAEIGGVLPRPQSYVAFLLRFDGVEFWANGEDRLHQRLRYDREGDGWSVRRLQP